MFPTITQLCDGRHIFLHSAHGFHKIQVSTYINKSSYIRWSSSRQ